MATPTDISQPIIEALYCEALSLADEIRGIFDLRYIDRPDSDGDRLRMAMSVEGLKATTRIMHVLAWLLNHRAYAAGDISEFQLRRFGTLPPDSTSDPANLALLERPTRDLIAESVAIHARVSRLDAAWRERFRMQPCAVTGMRERLGQAMRHGA